jgi:putative peptidoglycan lipid II flippase
VIETLQHRGIALSTSGAMILNFLFLGIVLYRKLDGYPLGYLLRGLVKIMAATGLMCGGIWGLGQILVPWLQGSVLMQTGALVLVIGVAVGIYGISLQLLRLPEFTLLTSKLAQRLRRS